MVTGTVPSRLPIISSQAGGSRQRFGLSQLQSGIVTVTILTLGLHQHTVQTSVGQRGREQRQHQCLPVSLGVSLSASLKCYPAVICNVFQTIYGVHRDESGRVKQQEEDQFISQKYFHKFESEDPIKSLKTVEVEKKKEKERQARNVSGRSKISLYSVYTVQCLHLHDNIVILYKL